MRRLYGLREGLLTAGLIALGPYFLVTASLGIYDAFVTGVVTAAALTSIRLALRPRIATALLLGGLLGAGGLTKPTAWAAAAVLPFTLLLFDSARRARRRLLLWAGTRRWRSLSAMRSRPWPACRRSTTSRSAGENHRALGQVFDDLGAVAGNGALDLGGHCSAT